MDPTEITDKAVFSCKDCEGSDLKSVGAVKTRGQRIYLMFTCLECGEPVALELDAIIAKLYQAPLAKGSNLVN